jgi:hypothetical protein
MRATSGRCSNRFRSYGLYRASAAPHHLSRPGIVRHPRALHLHGCAEFFYSLNVGAQPLAKPGGCSALLAPSKNLEDSGEQQRGPDEQAEGCRQY